MIEHEADSCLYLLPIQQAATLKDLEFVQQYLMDIADAITFVVTKVDTAHDEQEVEEVLDVVRSKLRSSLGLRNPRVIAVSAAEALRNPQSRYGVEFSKFVKDVVAFAEANRERLVVRRLISLEMSLMNAVAERVRDKEQEYQVRLDQLRHYVIEDLQSFVQRQVKDLEPALASACDLELLSNRFSVGSRVLDDCSLKRFVMRSTQPNPRASSSSSTSLSSRKSWRTSTNACRSSSELPMTSSTRT